MSKEKSNAISNYDEIKALKKRYLTAKRELKQVGSRTKRRELKEYMDGLKIELGWALIDCKEYEKGLALFRSVPWRTHGEMKCNGMAAALTELGYYDEAGRLLRAGLKRYSDSYALWAATGGLYESLGDDFGALRCIDIALQFAPEDNSTGLYNKALVLIKLGCYGDALPIVDELIERCPDDPKHLAERGALALDMGYPQEALQYYQKAMEVWQRSPNVYDGICIYSGLCSTYSELGMKKEAMEIALEGLKKFPDEDSIIYHNVGAVFFERGWRKEAEEILKKGIEKFPEDEELKTLLENVKDDTDDPDGGEKPPLLGLILLMGLIRRNLKNSRK